MSDDRVAWDDARLEAAFAAFTSATPTPSDLVPSTITAVQSRATRPRWRSTPLLGLAGVAVAAVAVVALVSWPRPTPVPVGQTVAVADLPVIEVPALIDRMADPQPEEVVVHGWFAVAPVEADCEVVVDPHPLIPDCEEWYRFLMAEPETLGGDRGGMLEPFGPHVVPMLRADSHIGIGSEFGETVEVLAVGHIADHRSGTCPAADQPECASRFVIDRLLPAGGDIVARPEPWASGAAPVDDADAVVSSLAAAVGPVSVVSIGTIDAAEVASIEPVLAMGSEPGGGTVWLVRALVGSDRIARTFGLVDGRLSSSAITEITASGPTDATSAPQAPEDPASSKPSAAPWPSATAPADQRTVRPIGDGRGGWEATFPIGDGETRRVTVIDRTGSLRDVRLPTESEAATLRSAVNAIQTVELDPTKTLVEWPGTACERDLGIEVTDGVHLTLTGARDAACRMARVDTMLVLQWDAPPGDLGVSDVRDVDVFPTSIAGLDVVPVSEAVAVRAADDDHEMAVKGAFRLDPRSDCGAPDLGPLLDPGCRSPVRTGTLFGPEGGDGIRFVTPNPNDLATASDTPVVLVGHFDDARADECADPAACRDVLVVDAIWVDGRLTSGHWSWSADGSTPEITPDVINRLLPIERPDERVLSVGTLRGSDLALLEPRVAGSRAASEPWVWHVTRLDEDRVRTFFVTQSQALEFVETRERRYFQEMADGTFVELESTLIID